jgi:SAM-dependent methyltransferase
MNTEELMRKYDAWHGQVYSGSNLDDPLRFPWYKSAFVHIKENARGNLLEIGCGCGEFAVWLAGILPEVNITAIDFSSAAIEMATENAAERSVKLKLAQDDARALKFADNHFDYIVSCECIEHVPQPQQMAHEIFRVLKPGGHFCITTENYLNGMLLAWAKSWITGEPFNSGSGVQPRENLFFFWHIIGYLNSSGLVIDKVESCHYQWLLLPRVDPAKLCTKQFSSAWLRSLAKPFGRHFSFFGRKPNLRAAKFAAL